MSQFEGIVQTTGEHDSGKTLFAFQCGVLPERICYFDDDIKGRRTVENIKKAGGQLGAHYDLTEIARGKVELKFFEEVRKIIDSIKPGLYDAIIWDTWSMFASKTHSFVVRNEGKFRETWNKMGEIHGSQQWQEARNLEAQLISQMANLTKTVILITHLKKHRIGKVEVPGKFEPNSSPVLERVPNLRLWLRHNPKSPVPIGLILKRFTLEKIVDGRIRSINVLPRKITPRPEDESLWDTIDWYMDNPVGNREPRPEELPDAFEMSILDGTLTVEQKHTFNEILRTGVGFKDEEAALTASVNQEDLSEQVKELFAQKTPLPVIARTLNITIEEVKRLKSEITF